MRVWVQCTRKTEGVKLLWKKANTACGSVPYMNKEKLHGHFENPNTPCKKIFTSSVWNKICIYEQFKGTCILLWNKNLKHHKKFRWGTEWVTFKLPRSFYLCFQRNATMQFEECHIPGQNTFLNPHFYSVVLNGGECSW